MNDEPNGAERPASESVSERMAALGRRSGEARRKRKEQQEQKAAAKQRGRRDHRARVVDQAERELDKAEETGEISNMAAFVALQRLALDQPAADPRTSWATVYRVDELLTRIARLQLTVASLKFELKLQGAEVDDVELDDHVDDLIKIFLRTMTEIADKAEHSPHGRHVFEAARREIARALDDEERVGTARPGPELLAEMEAARAEKKRLKQGEATSGPVSPSPESKVPVPLVEPVESVAEVSPRRIQDGWGLEVDETIR